MGEVYRAADSRLKRDVAIKVLPAALAQDADRLARFRREAELLAALNHPNIAAVYGLEESEGVVAIVLELVDGEMLGGSLPLADALPIARQIADALEAAHEKGIVHRDLKPANVKVTAAGTVKVLDFGLAKALDSGGGAAATMMSAGGESATRLQTIAAPATTEIGVILGTVAYMSPEQARGKPVDRRTDIWAFGCVLYEILSGARAFPGDGPADTLAHVVSSEPDWRALPADTPPSIVRLLERCLEKDPKRRLHDIADARMRSTMRSRGRRRSGWPLARKRRGIDFSGARRRGSSSPWPSRRTRGRRAGRPKPPQLFDLMSMPDRRARARSRCRRTAAKSPRTRGPASGFAPSIASTAA